jgi:hypothetical protein
MNRRSDVHAPAGAKQFSEKLASEAEQSAEKLFSLARNFPQRLKPPLILLDLRRGLKPRPFKAAVRREFVSKLLKWTSDFRSGIQSIFCECG